MLDHSITDYIAPYDLYKTLNLISENFKCIQSSYLFISILR